jgi:hypothetical protein
MTTTILIVLIAVLIAASFLGYRRASGHADRARRIATSQAEPVAVADFTTPQGAILMLEEAFRRRDLDGAVAAKDFRVEAELALNSESASTPAIESQIVARAADLEQEFRKLMLDSWPDFSGVTTVFTGCEPYPPPPGKFSATSFAVVTEVNRFTGGGFSEHRILVAQGAGGWRVLNPL